MKTKSLIGTLALATLLMFSSCSKEEQNLAGNSANGIDQSTIDLSMLSAEELAKMGKQKINLNITGLEPLGSDFRYEGWIIVNGMPVSTGKFKINSSGKMTPGVFHSNISDLQDATTFVLTIEPQPDMDPAPSATKILGGNFNGSSATITTAHMAALGNNFMNATGKYILATPTTATTADENSGLWFIDLASGSPMAGLDLPLLPAGWRYEGWAVVNGQPVSSGRFLYNNMVDMDDPFSGPLSGPPFPGEDYVTNAPAGHSFPTDLAGGVVVVSIEPYPDDSPAPFLLKPLAAMVPANATDHTTYMMMNKANMFPTGTVTK